MADKFPSTLLVSLADKLAKLGDDPSRRDVETEIRKADLDLLDKINQLSQANSGGPFVPLLPNPIISGEPSLGTPRPQTGTHTGWLYTNTTPTAITWYTVTFTVPAGTKAVTCGVGCVGSGAVDQLRWRPYNNGDSYANSFHRLAISGPTNTEQDGQAMVLVDSSGRVDFAVSFNNSNIKIGYPQFYWQ